MIPIGYSTARISIVEYYVKDLWTNIEIFVLFLSQDQTLDLAKQNISGKDMFDKVYNVLYMIYFCNSVGQKHIWHICQI